jgi:hypothetical protein
MLLAAVVAAVLAFLFFPRAVGGLAAAITAGVADLFAAATAATQGIVNSAVAWIKTGIGVAAPRSILGGLLVTVAAVPIARSEFNVMRMSIELVWPPGMHPELIALSFVLMTLSVGLLLHASHGSGARVPLAVLALALAALQSTLAYHRTMELTRPSVPSVTAAASDTDLIIAGQPGAEPAAVPSAAPPPAAEGNRLMAYMASLLAFTLSLGGVAVGWGAFSLANPGLVWIAAVPLLLPLLLFSSLVRLAQVPLRAFHAAVESVVELWVERCRALLRTIKRLLPADWSEEGDAWHRARCARRTGVAVQQRDWEVQTVEHQRIQRAETDWEESDRAFQDAERERDQQSIAAAHQATRELIRTNHIEAVRAFLDGLKERRQAFLDEASAETFAELKRQIPKVPREYAEMLFWPMGRLRRLAKELRNTLPPLPLPEPVAEAQPVPIQEDSQS